MSRDKDRETESRRIIGRVGAEVDGSMMQRVRNHMSGRDAEGEDRAELWGTRVGRWFGLALLVYLIWWLIGFAASVG